MLVGVSQSSMRMLIDQENRFEESIQDQKQKPFLLSDMFLSVGSRDGDAEENVTKTATTKVGALWGVRLFSNDFSGTIAGGYAYSYANTDERAIQADHYYVGLSAGQTIESFRWKLGVVGTFSDIYTGNYVASDKSKKSHPLRGRL